MDDTIQVAFILAFAYSVRSFSSVLAFLSMFFHMDAERFAFSFSPLCASRPARSCACMPSVL